MTDRRPLYLVTGATGFLGRHLLLALRSAQPDVRIAVLVRNDESWLSQDWIAQIGEVDVITGSLLDAGEWQDDPRLDGLRGIFHLAAEVVHSRRDPWAMIRTNVDGTLAIVRAAAHHHARLVFASTSGTVGCSRDPEYAPGEDAPYAEAVVGRWPYYASKVRAERESRALARELGVEIVVIRPPILLGPGDHRFRSTSNVIRLLRGRLPFLIEGSIHFVDIRDVAAAMVRAMMHPSPNEAYHFPGTVWSLDHFFRQVAAAAGMLPSWRKLPLGAVLAVSRVLEALRIRPHLVPDPVLLEMAQHHWGLSTMRSVSELSFSARPPEETIRDTVNWLVAGHPGLNRPGGSARAIGDRRR